MLYDLEERTINFSYQIIGFCKKVERIQLLKPLANQLIRSGTSIGANYCEANGSTSKRDFKNKIHICKKEAQETRYWLRLLDKELPQYQEDIKSLFDENQELIKIFSAIAEKSK